LISELPEPNEQHPDPRNELDDALRVIDWSAPGMIEPDADLPPGAPSWWKGEEAATAEFFRAMGVKLGPNGEVVPR
jgi:hypothetical protein